MAQFGSDFSGDTLGGVPAGLASEWEDSGGNSVVDATALTFFDTETDAAFGAKAFELVGLNSFQRQAYRFSSVTSNASQSVKALVALDNSTAAIATLITYGAGASGAARTGYMLLVNGAGGLTLRRASGGSTSDIGSGSVTVGGANDGLVCQLDASPDGSGGVDIEAYVWQIGGSKPVTPTITHNDASPLSSGWAGIGAMSSNGTVSLYFGEIAVGTAGDLAVLPSESATPTIGNVDGDNAVNQGQLVNIDVSNFTETITSGDIGGVAFPSIPDNDPADNVIQVRIPVTLSAGTYDVTISGATETDTISGVTYAVTHQYTAPYAPVDSNSLFAGQSLTDDSYFRIVTGPSNGTLDAATAESSSQWGNDVADIYTPDAGYTGNDTITLEILYADGTTAQWTVTIAVQDGVVVGARGRRGFLRPCSGGITRSIVEGIAS